jgi:hypothetical protein
MFALKHSAGGFGTRGHFGARLGKEQKSNITAQRYSGSLLGRDMRASMTLNVLARSPKTHSNPTINRLLPGRNRALLLHQQITDRKGLGDGHAHCAFCEAGAQGVRQKPHLVYRRLRAPFSPDVLE